MKLHKYLRAWLLLGLIMVFFQIVIGGVTRLTGSGLSITKWEIVTGTFPPLNEKDWQEEFDKYKATPQYRMINEGMDLRSFKAIYFWEYFHRLWARSMGFVFVFPFLFFLIRGAISPSLLKDLGVLIFLAFLAAIFGWIMVMSGLVDKPWVSPYKLSIHFLLGISVFSWLLKIIFKETVAPGMVSPVSKNTWRLGYLILGIFVLQLFLGGIVSGSHAALFYPTWPDMNGSFIPSVIFNREAWNIDAFYHYDRYPLIPALVQFFHRMTAYLLLGLGIIWLIRINKSNPGTNLRRWGYFFIIALILQAVLGILTVINSVGKIPVTLGVLHQAWAIITLTGLLGGVYYSGKKAGIGVVNKYEPASHAG